MKPSNYRFCHFALILLLGLFSNLFGFSCSSEEEPSCEKGLLFEGKCFPWDCPDHECFDQFVCSEGTCVDSRCLGVICATDQACAAGDCYPMDCKQRNCPGLGEICIEEECRTTDCAGVDCPAGERCAKGHCYPEECETHVCYGLYEVCVDELCVEQTCVDVDCPSDSACAYGQCYPVDCDELGCEDDEVCVSLTCVEAACLDVVCETDATCIHGSCYTIHCPGERCDSGQVCVQNACVDENCVDLACLDTPEAVCEGDSLVSYAESGHCEDGFCLYDEAGRIDCEFTCVAGACTECQPDCEGKACGENGCGGTCPPGCGAFETCMSGQCEPCQPNCEGKVCGGNGCGGTCPPGCGAFETCEAGQCEPCQPNCEGNVCGDDGCGGSCGSCGAYEQCNAGTCECSFTECIGTCCSSGQVCAADACCTPLDEEICNALDDDCDGEVDEEMVCGQCYNGGEAIYVASLPSICDPASTGCWDCLYFEGLLYYCRSFGGSAYEYYSEEEAVAMCQQVENRCLHSSCGVPAYEKWCDGEGHWLPQAPDDPEICDGVDNNCNNLTDEDEVCGVCPSGWAAFHLENIGSCSVIDIGCDRCGNFQGQFYLCLSPQDGSTELYEVSAVDAMCDEVQEVCNTYRCGFPPSAFYCSSSYEWIHPCPAECQ